MDENWIDHHRNDGERVGWIRMTGDGFVAVDILGRPITEQVDWLQAEEALDGRGLSFLADPWLLRLPAGEEVRVRIVEVSPDRIRVAEDAMGAASVVGARPREHTLPFPAPDALRPVREHGG
ncbi:MULTISPECIES: hypothetical protein [unclassified Nesterenkonia]|uniref:hypothetical protein n=1 Tax=unclassified Nesterenkonia TaxID=2629769 RepID=UPI0008720519|nr:MULTISPECIES: hypothetical protein [unclassified Nesterenkonia]MDS2172032.1 hypothetical protein [Nesterenkonia sp. CL21]OSM43682.1 hypothetical protein BCY76_007110 [Nesterenkonia sp. PF2B19]